MEGMNRSSYPGICCKKIAALGLMGIKFDEKYGVGHAPLGLLICIEGSARVCQRSRVRRAHNGSAPPLGTVRNDAQQDQTRRGGEGRGQARGLTEASAGATPRACGRRARQGTCWV